MKPGFFYPHRRRLRAALVLPAAAFLLCSCQPPASQLPASPSSAAAVSPPPAAGEVRRISGLPNMAQIQRRLNNQYAESAKDTDGVEFTPPTASGTTVSASITYDEGKLRPMTIGGTDYEIKTVTITRVVDGKTIPTTVEYKDESSTTRKTVTSRYVPPPNAASNNARQSLEGGPALHISGEEKDGAGKTLRTFTAIEEIQDGKTVLKTTYRRPDNEGFTETVTTENGVLTQKEITYSDEDAAAKNIKTETITYKSPAESMFYPARQKRTLTVYEDAEGEETKRDEVKDDGSTLITMRDKSTITTTPAAGGGTVAEYKDPDGTVTKTVETTRTPGAVTVAAHKNPHHGTETKNVKTAPTAGGVTVAVHKDVDGTKTQRVETASDGSTITTTPTAGGGTLAVHEKPDGTETRRVETASDGSTITTTPTTAGVGTLAVHKDPGGNETQRVETRSDGSTITTKTTAGGITKELVIHPSVTAIERWAFWSNDLTSVSIGNGVKTIGSNAFADNPKLKTVTITGTGPVESDVFAYKTYKDSRVYTKGIFSNSRSSGIELIIEDGITAIGDYAFEKNELTSLTIPSSVTAIGLGAFEKNKLTSLTIGNGVKTIRDYAFFDNDLTSVSIPPLVRAIGKGAFFANKLTSLTIPSSVTEIGHEAFENNPALKTVAITGTGPVASNAFKGIFSASGSSGIDLIIQDGITAIGHKAFSYNKLTSVSIPRSVIVIGHEAFSYNKLTSVSIPPSVTAIGARAFYYNELTSVILTRALYHARSYAFNSNPPGLQFYNHAGLYLGTN